jgi:hypothetical protein
MEHSDCMQRQIDQLGKVLGMLYLKLQGLKSEGSIMEAEKLVCQTFSQELDIELDELLQIKSEKLISYLKNVKKFNLHHFEDLANIILFLADHTAYNKPEIYEKCLLLFEYVSQNSEDVSMEIIWKMGRIEQEVTNI